MAVNDRIWTSLSQHGGGTINERVYNYLGSLGFTGTISDRLAKYTHNNKHGWQALIEGFGLSGSAGVLRQELFGEGQEGVMYVPQPTYLGQQVLYQDAAGTVPVTSDGDPVGLMLDLSRGLVLGPEVVANGTFGEDLSGWAPVGGAALDVVAGELEVTTSSAGGAYANVPTEAGKTYEFKFEYRLVGGSDPSIRLSNGETSFSNDIGIFLPSENGFVFTASGPTTTVYLRSGSDPATVYWDNISVRELPGNHATAPSDAARPLHPGLEYDGADDLLDSVPPSNRDTATFTVMMTVKLNSIHDGVLLPSSSTSGYLFIYAGSNQSLVPYAAVGSPQIYLDGASIATRGDLYDGLIDLNTHIVEARNVSFADSRWSEMKLSGYISGFYVDGDIAATLIYESASSDDDDKARAYLANLAGITL